MKVEFNGLQYARFGEGFVRRANGDADWEFVPADAMPQDALLEVGVQERLREERIKSGPRQRRVFIERAPANIKMGEELGFDGTENVSPQNASETRNAGDTLAQRLNDAGHEGSRERVTELRLDQLAKGLGMTAQELKDRFAGRFQTDDD